MNGKPIAQDMNHNELSGIHDSKPVDNRPICFNCKQPINHKEEIQIGVYNYHPACLPKDYLKPGKITLVDSNETRIAKLQSEVNYYQKELAKAHELLGRVTHQLSERWDNVRLTKFYPTDNLHNKRTINNPIGKKES